ncbi:hypothetical protein AOLI_G00104080 [Acnodon oligacanthus]
MCSGLFRGPGAQQQHTTANRRRTCWALSVSLPSPLINVWNSARLGQRRVCGSAAGHRSSTGRTSEPSRTGPGGSESPRRGSVTRTNRAGTFLLSRVRVSGSRPDHPRAESLQLPELSCPAARNPQPAASAAPRCTASRRRNEASRTFPLCRSPRAPLRLSAPPTLSNDPRSVRTRSLVYQD